VVQGGSLGSVKILGIPDRQNPWWKGITRLDIAVNNGSYRLAVYDGSSQNGTSIDLSRSASEPIQLVFDQIDGGTFSVLDENNQEIKRVDFSQVVGLNLSKGLFPTQQVYVGTSTAPGTALIITGLSVGTPPDGKWTAQDSAGAGLLPVANSRKLTIGTEFHVSSMIDQRYCLAMQRNFNVAILSEFSLKDFWQGPGQYDFAALDHAVDFANSRGWRVRASHLVWGSANAIPDWLAQGNYSRDDYIRILQDHIKTIVNRYKGRVQEWSIANEAIERSFHADADFWNGKIGPEYIEMAFRWAREADPNGVLIFNGNENESPRDAETSRRISKMYDTVKTLKAKGVPIDVVGMEMHLLLPKTTKVLPQKQDVIRTMQQFGSLGVGVYVTEFDVDLQNVPGSQAERLTFESQLYGNMVGACSESGVCRSFATWGISDSTSWITCQQDTGCQKDPNGDPLMFDTECVNGNGTGGSRV
jgi:endo-1,4-beta-xylanase